MNLLPKTECAKVKASWNEYTELVVWRKWLWFNYGHREFKIKEFWQSEESK